jgi:lipid-binding SYLF domain-containing protein
MQVDDIKESQHPCANPLAMDDTEKPRPSGEHHPIPAPAPQESKKEQRLSRFNEKVTKFTAPINKLSVAAGCESFLPLPLEEECRKAARIITSLSACKFAPAKTGSCRGAKTANHERTDVPPRPAAPDSYETYPPSAPVVTIPPSAIANAVGVLTLTTLRMGFGRTAISTSSGVLIARHPETRAWGLPTAMRAHSVGGGPVALGVGITDRVYLINDHKTLEDFGKRCFVVDAEGLLAIGSFGGGGGLTFVVPCKGKHHHPHRHHGRHHRQKKGWGWWRGGEQQQQYPAGDAEARAVMQPPAADEKTPLNPEGAKEDRTKGVKESLGRPVHCYMRCRGLYAGFQAQGAAIMPRLEANEAFYGCPLTAEQLIRGGAEPTGEGWREPAKVLVDALEWAGRIPPVDRPVVEEEPVQVTYSKEDELGSHS